MQAKENSVYSREILDTFRLLDLDTSEKRERLLRLADTSNGKVSDNHNKTFLNTRNNTSDEEPVGDA